MLLKTRFPQIACIFIHKSTRARKTTIDQNHSWACGSCQRDACPKKSILLLIKDHESLNQRVELGQTLNPETSWVVWSFKSSVLKPLRPRTYGLISLIVAPNQWVALWLVCSSMFLKTASCAWGCDILNRPVFSLVKQTRCGINSSMKF